MSLDALYIVAECKPFSKAGGVGDVAGELPAAIQTLGVNIEVVTPLYESVSRASLGEPVEIYDVLFEGAQQRVYRHEVRHAGVKVHLLKNDHFFGGAYGSVYVHSTGAPFRDDARRFSFFSKAALALVKTLAPRIVHINDWVLGYRFGWMVLEGLPQKRILTIHNVGYQGNQWKPDIANWEIDTLLRHSDTTEWFLDPRAEWHSVNALRLGVELADFVTTVSPTYAAEIQRPEAPERLFEGGHGLDAVLRKVAARGRLIGITNGFDYTCEPTPARFAEAVAKKAFEKSALAPYFANPRGLLLGFVGRAVEQKFRLLTEPFEGQTILEHILDIPNLNLALLATGLPEYEAFIGNVAVRRYDGTRSYDDLLGGSRRKNYVAALAFDRTLAARISLASDVFLMPSVSEPCGITQLEAMQNATPPLVRLTGGLADTVVPYPGKYATGFGFDGETRTELLRNLLFQTRRAAQLYSEDPERFARMRRAAFAQRFSWSTAARIYIEQVYGALE